MIHNEELSQLGALTSPSDREDSNAIKSVFQILARNTGEEFLVQSYPDRDQNSCDADFRIDMVVTLGPHLYSVEHTSFDYLRSGKRTHRKLKSGKRLIFKHFDKQPSPFPDYDLHIVLPIGVVKNDKEARILISKIDAAIASVSQNELDLPLDFEGHRRELFVIEDYNCSGWLILPFDSTRRTYIVNGITPNLKPTEEQLERDFLRILAKKSAKLLNYRAKYEPKSRTMLVIQCPVFPPDTPIPVGIRTVYGALRRLAGTDVIDEVWFALGGSLSSEPFLSLWWCIDLDQSRSDDYEFDVSNLGHIRVKRTREWSTWFRSQVSLQRAGSPTKVTRESSNDVLWP